MVLHTMIKACSNADEIQEAFPFPRSAVCGSQGTPDSTCGRERTASHNRDVDWFEQVRRPERLPDAPAGLSPWPLSEIGPERSFSFSSGSNSFTATSRPRSLSCATQIRPIPPWSCSFSTTSRSPRIGDTSLIAAQTARSLASRLQRLCSQDLTRLGRRPSCLPHVQIKTVALP